MNKFDYLDILSDFENKGGPSLPERLILKSSIKSLKRLVGLMEKKGVDNISYSEAVSILGVPSSAMV